MWTPTGLTEVRDEDLQKMLRYLHRGELNLPLTIVELTRCGLQHCAISLLHVFRTLDAEASKALLIAVLAERTAYATGTWQKRILSREEDPRVG